MKTLEEYSDLYKKFRKRLDKIPKWIKRTDFAPDDFFSYGNRYDLIANGLNIIMDILNNNIYSQGIDNSCRSILEAFAVLSLSNDGQNGYLTRDRKKLYQFSYAPIETYNNFDFFDETLNNADSLTTISRAHATQRNKDTKKCEDLIYKIFGTQINDNNRDKLRDSSFYLKKGFGGMGFDFKKYVNKYDVNKPSLKEMYHFFSTMIHPWCETDKALLTQTLNKREEYIDQILDLVNKYIDDNLTPFTYDDVEDFDLMFDNIPDKNKQILIEFETHCNEVGQLIEAKTGLSYFLLEQVGHLYKDVYFYHCNHLLQLEIIKTKSLIEMVSALIFFLYSAKNKDERDGKMRGFVLSSRVRFLGIDSSNLQTKYPNLYSEIKDIYDTYYCNEPEFQNVSPDAFVKGMSKSWLFPINGDSTTMNEFVSQQHEVCLKGTEFEDLSTDIEKLYGVSLDLEHSCGYCYNATKDILDYYALGSHYYCSLVLCHIFESTSIRIKNDVYYNFFNRIFVEATSDFGKYAMKMIKKYGNNSGGYKR